jgi:hypothetical protein
MLAAARWPGISNCYGPTKVVPFRKEVLTQTLKPNVWSIVYGPGRLNPNLRSLKPGAGRAFWPLSPQTHFELLLGKESLEKGHGFSRAINDSCY